MSNPTSEHPEHEHDQDAEPSLNAPEEGRPDGTEASDTDDGTEEDST